MMLTMAEQLNRVLAEAMDEDAHIVLLGEDVAQGGAFGVTAGLAARFGTERVMDMPISESSFTSMAAGAAASGLRPVVDLMFADFIGTAFDPVMNFIAQAKDILQLDLPITIRMAYGSGDGSGAQHSQALHALLSHLPGLVVAMPSRADDAAECLRAALQHAGPVILMEPRQLYDQRADLGTGSYPLGKARLRRHGDRATVVAAGHMAHAAEQACQDFPVDLIDPVTICPLDEALILKSVAKTGRLLVVDEGWAVCGFARDVIARVCTEAFSSLKAPPVLLTPPHQSVPAAVQLEQDYLPSINQIEDAVLRLIRR